MNAEVFSMKRKHVEYTNEVTSFKIILLDPEFKMQENSDYSAGESEMGTNSEIKSEWKSTMEGPMETEYETKNLLFMNCLLRQKNI